MDALGGNALVSCRIVRRETGAQKNQAYNLVSLTGDVVLVSVVAGSGSASGSASGPGLGLGLGLAPRATASQVFAAGPAAVQTQLSSSSVLVGGGS